MILFDHPRPVQFRRFRRTAHLMSDVPGAEGTRELLEFGHVIGLKPHWLQNAGTPTEHFDLFDAAIDRARLAGAVEVSGRELVRLAVRPKREAQKAAAAAEVAGG